MSWVFSSGGVNLLNQEVCHGSDDWLATNVHGSPILAFRASMRELRHTFGTFIFASVFATRICDFVTRARLVKAYGML